MFHVKHRGKMLKSNWHTHTYRCGHATGTEEEYVLAAIKAWVKRLGFSDHCPFPGIYQDRARMDYEEFEDYLNKVKYLKEKYRDKIEIYTGLEVEYLDEFLDTLIDYRKRCDYLIIGQHCFSIDYDDAYFIKDREGLMKYCDLIEKGCEKGLIDCIAHPDVCMWSYPRINDAVIEAANRLADISLKHDIPLEANCGSGVKKGKKEYEDGLRYGYPVKEFFEVFKEKGCKVIIGLDIHNPDLFSTDEYINRVKEVLTESGCDADEDYDLIADATERKRKYGYLI